MREENGDKEEGKRCKSPPNISAMKYTSWEKQGDLGNGGLDGLDHPGSNVNMSSPSSKYKYALVCSSNVNRSVMAHIALDNCGFHCNSYGIGTDVKLPGRSRNAPAVFPFGTEYLEMYDSLSREDNELYTKNGVLKLLLRNSKAKCCPERWQDAPGFEIASFDVVLCFENRIFDICIEDAQNREPEEFKPVHFVAMPVKDTPEDAEKAEQDVMYLVRMLEESDDLEVDAASIVGKFEDETQRSLLHQVCHI